MRETWADEPHGPRNGVYLVAAPSDRDGVGGCEDVVPAAFLRFERPELEDKALVVRATPAEVTEARRVNDGVPLGYLYEITSEYDPREDFVVSAGHYDPVDKVWVFSGNLPGIIGLTESLRSDDQQPSSI